jgi:hypothetical protein
MNEKLIERLVSNLRDRCQDPVHDSNCMLVDNGLCDCRVARDRLLLNEIELEPFIEGARLGVPHPQEATVNRFLKKGYVITHREPASCGVVMRHTDQSRRTILVVPDGRAMQYSVEVDGWVEVKE